MAGLIVLASPIADPTPEILARTRPNLFDLAVALLSGLAGGYATIRGRGGAAVGVAIATALMPPLAVVAYGTVLGQWQVAKGASLLFVTNMVAIAAAVAATATWYGFARAGLRRKLAGQTLLAGLLLVPLAIPLFHSLQAIARETYLTRTAQDVMQQLAVRENESRIETFQVSFPQDAPARVDAVVLTREPIPDLQPRAEQEINSRSGEPVSVRVDQVRVAELRPAMPASAVANPVQAAPVQPPRPALAEALRAAFPMPLAMVEVDEDARRMSILPKPDPAYGLSALHRMEQELAARHEGWQVRVLPPQGPFERLLYPRGMAELSAGEHAKLDDVIWALKAWGVARVNVTGFASSAGEGPEKLARARAGKVAETLRAAGIEAGFEGRYPALGQAVLERELGLTAFQAVEITPAW